MGQYEGSSDSDTYAGAASLNWWVADQNWVGNLFSDGGRAFPKQKRRCLKKKCCAFRIEMPCWSFGFII